MRGPGDWRRRLCGPTHPTRKPRCGGSTRLSNILHAVMIVGFVGILGPLIARIPMAALAGVTAYIGICLLEWSTWFRLAKMRRVDAAAFSAEQGRAVFRRSAIALPFKVLVQRVEIAVYGGVGCCGLPA